MPSPPHNAVALELVLNGFGELLDGVRQPQWTAPTPCVEWDVRALVNHVAMGQLLFASVLRGLPPLELLAGYQDGDPAGEFRRSSEALLDAFDLPAVMSQTFEVPFGVVPGGVMVMLRTVEGLVHGWDLAMATGQSTSFPEEIAGTALVASQQLAAGLPRGEQFAEAQPVASDAPALDQLVALLGHRV
jgi:uncharacterized protein (TIGR03086 family)